jgi:hypothetical protein
MNSFFTNLIRKVMSFHWRARLLFYVRVEGGRKLTSKFVHRPQDSLLLHIGCVSIRHTYNEYVIEGVPVWVVDVQPEATKKLYIYSFLKSPWALLVYIECGIIRLLIEQSYNRQPIGAQCGLMTFYGHNTTHIELLIWFYTCDSKAHEITNLSN